MYYYMRKAFKCNLSHVTGRREGEVVEMEMMEAVSPTTAHKMKEARPVARPVARSAPRSLKRASGPMTVKVSARSRSDSPCTS